MWFIELFVQQFLSKLLEFMLEVCPTYTDTGI